MNCLMILRFFCYSYFMLITLNESNSTNRDSGKKHNYYFSVNGSDKNDGSLEHPFKTIELFNSMRFNPGDSVFFKAGEIFKGNVILDSTKTGVNEKPVV